MRFPFVDLPGQEPMPRPVLSVSLQGLEKLPLKCLVDTGSLRNRFAGWLAEAAGVTLEGAPEDRFAIGGIVMVGRSARVGLRLGEDVVDTAVTFCDPWPFGFQVLGQEGFLRYFRVTICAAEEWLECVPEIVES